VEGLHVVGGITSILKISINFVLNLYVMHVCVFEMISCISLQV
jgi:hypothetical protein